MTAKELMELSQRLHLLCRQAELAMEESAESLWTEELSARLRSLKEATDLEPR